MERKESKTSRTASSDPNHVRKRHYSSSSRKDKEGIPINDRTHKSPYTHKRNTDAVVALARKKSEDTSQKVDQAIKHLIRTKSVINFNMVSTISGVSKSYLYSSPSIRDRIESLRKQQQEVKLPKSLHQDMSMASKDATIEMLRDKNRRLQSEIDQLKKQIRQIMGTKYEDIGKSI